VCIREVQKTLAHSSKLLLEKTIVSLELQSYFKVYSDKIETPGGGLIIFHGMQDHTAESIKSLEGFKIAWVEEAQTLSSRSLSLLRPTIRAEGSQIWASWNPRWKSDAIDDFFRTKRPMDAVMVRTTWRDNPWFPGVLQPMPNQGKGAAAMRIEAVRRIFPKCWFNEASTEAGRDALGYYHERKDENRNVGLGPEHDWSSHAADAFGLMALAYEEPGRRSSFNRAIIYPDLGTL
jgi:hypothetical protein